MKKLMTMIAAVATAFGLYAAGAVLQDGTSFEAGESGVTDAKWAPQAGSVWAVTEGITEFDLGSYGVDDPAYAGYGESSNKRRTEKFQNGTDQYKYLKLATGNDTLSRSIGEGQIYFDQLVKFTGFEDPQTEFATGSKIAVWMSATETEGEGNDIVPGETNLYVAVGTANGAEPIKNVKIDKEVSDNVWYRLTIKSLGGVDGNRIGFRVWINGVEATIVTDDRTYYENSADLSGDAAKLYDDGKLFVAMDATSATLESVSYKGIGALDDVVVSQDAPDFDAQIPFAVTLPSGVEIVSLYAGDVKLEKDTDGKYWVKPNTEVTFNLKAAPNYRLDLVDPIKKNVTGDVNLTSDLEGKVIEGYAKITRAGVNPIIVGEAEIDDAIATVQDGDIIDFLKDCTALDEAYVFAEGTRVTVTAKGNWDVAVPADKSITDLFGTLPEKNITVTFATPGSELSSFFLAGNIYGNGDSLTKITANGYTMLNNNLTIGATYPGIEGGQSAELKADYIGNIVDGGDLAGDYTITLIGSAKVITKSELTVSSFGLASASDLAVDYDEATGYYTYSLATAPETGFMVIISGKPAGTYDTLAAAVEAAPAGATIQLLDDQTVTGICAITKSITLDLNGNTLSKDTTEAGYKSKMIVVQNGATLTVDGTDEGSTVKGGIYAGVSATSFGTIIVNGGTYYPAEGKADCAFSSNGNAQTEPGNAITINNAEVYSPNDIAIYLAGLGTYAINNSKVEGYTAIYQKAGTLTIDATSVISATGDTYIAAEPNTNGANKTGDAIVMDSNTAYKGLISLTVADGATVTTTATDAAAIRETITAGDESTTVKINAPQIANIALTPDFAAKVAAGQAQLPGFVAVAGGKPYATLAAAVAAAQTTDTVTLLANVTLTETLQITKATAINLAGKTVTFGDGLKNGIVTTEAAQELVISNGNFAVAGTRPAKGYAFVLYRVNALIKDVEMDLEGFEYGLEAETMLSPMSDNWTVPLVYEIVCENVNVKGNGSLFHFENVEATLDADCSAELKGTSFGGAHAAAIYSSCGALVTVEGGSYTHENALQTGNLGGDIIVEDGVFTGNIKSWMLDEDTRDFASVNKANITIKAGKFTGNFVYADGCTKDSQLLKVVISGGDFSDTTIPVKFIEEKEGYDASWVASETYANYVTPAWTPAQDFGGGTGDEADPFIIATADHFVELQTKIAAGNAYARKFFKLVPTEEITLEKWTGIGENTNGGSAARPFAGTFNGNGAEITVKFSATKKYMGLFNLLANGAVVSNLTINASLDATTIDPTIKDFGFAALAGRVDTATIENVTVEGSIGASDTPATHNAAAMIVFLGDDGAPLIKDCVNNANVFCAKDKVGGIVGFASKGNKTFVNCVNNGTITATGVANNGVAGIVGFFQSEGTLSFENCKNTGVITGEEGSMIGSFVGKLNSNKNFVTGTGTNTAQDDILAVGKVAAANTVSDFQFATVAGDVATFVADDVLAAGNAYKVMAPSVSPVLELTEADQTVSFDTNLVKVASFAGITVVDGLELKETQAGGIVTFTAAVPGPVYPDDWPTTDPATKEKYVTWATTYAEQMKGLEKQALQDAFLLNCDPTTLATEKPEFKITKIEKVEGEWKITVKSTNTKGVEFNGKVVTKAFEDVGCKTEVPTPAGTETELFWEAFLVFPAAE